jgi:hypothetical protein
MTLLLTPAVAAFGISALASAKPNLRHARSHGGTESHQLAAAAGAALHRRDDHLGGFFESAFRCRLRPPFFDLVGSGYVDLLEQAAVGGGEGI